MNYLIIAIIGLMAGSVINLYVFGTSETKHRLPAYFGLFYKRSEYIVTELLSITLLLLLYRKYQLSGQLLSYSILLLLLTAAAVIDIRKQIIPDKLVLAGFAVGLIMLFINDHINWLSAVLAVIIVSGPLLLISVVTKEAIGMGDVKLLTFTGIFLGLEKIVSALMLSLFLSGAVGLILITIKLSNRSKKIPFAPFVLVGTLLVMLL